MPLSLWGGSSTSSQQLTSVGDDAASFKILDGDTVRAIRATGGASVSLANDVLSVNVSGSALTAVGDDSASLRILDGSRVRALRGSGGTQISLDQPAGILSITSQGNITGFGDNASNGVRLFHETQVKSLKGGAYIEVLRDNGGDSAVVVRANNDLQAALDSKQSGFAVNGGSIQTGMQLLLNGRLLSLNDSTDIAVKMGASGGQDYLYFTIIRDDLAPLGSPAFTGTATAESLNVTGSLTIAGQAVPRANQVALQHTLSGGGTVTWTGTHLRWSQRVLALPSERAELASEGFHEIECPTSGTITLFNDPAIPGGTVTCTADGVPLSQFHALYYEIQSTRPSAASRFRVINFNSLVWAPTGNWLLLAVHNGDNGQKWLPGLVHIPRSITMPATSNTVTGQYSWLAPTASPTFNGRVIVQTDSTSGGIQVSPVVQNAESSIGFYTNTNRTVSANGDLWVIGQNAWANGAGPRTFAIGAHGPNACLSINSARNITIPYNLVLSGSMTSRLRVTADSANGMIQCSPLANGSESSIGFYRNTNRGESAPGDIWVVGHAAHLSGDRGFAIGANALGPALSITAAGAVSIPGTLAVTGAVTVGGSNISSLYQARNPVQGQILVSTATPPVPSVGSTSGTSTITTVTRSGVGIYVVNWSPNINSTTYGVIGILRNTAGYLSYNGTTGTSMNINTFNTSGVAVDSSFSFYIFI